jgi:L-glyceraldehyde 3-phosphate reductase
VPDTAAWVLHVDLDQFLAAVEVLRRPELAGLPLVVGGRGDPTERAVVSTASYEARAFGVRSGMPLRTAARRCPDAVFLPVDRPVYEEASARVMATLRSVPGAVVEVLGWDEAFVGLVTDAPEQAAREVQAAVLAATGLHCSVGIGDTLVRAKTATDLGKPRGTFRLTRENWMEVMGDRPTRALWGVGGRISQRLEGLGIRTVRELATSAVEPLAAEFGPSTGPHLGRLGRGGGRRTVDDTPWVPRAHGHETTYQQDLVDPDEIASAVRVLADRVVVDLRAEGRACARVHLKVRFRPFHTVTRVRTLPEPTLDPAVVARTALALLAGLEDDRPVRLLGVRGEMVPPAGGDAPRGRTGGAAPPDLGLGRARPAGQDGRMTSYEAAPDRYDAMEYRHTGHSGLQLPVLSLGLWQNFGTDRPEETQRAILRRAFDRGVTHIDLANNYGPPYGRAEENFGRYLREDLAPYRDELVISTKAGYDMWPGPYGQGGGSRKYVLASLDQSLARMGLEYVDIFYSHRFDPDTPVEETMRALDHAVRQGKALYAGISSYSPEKTREAAGIARDLGTPLLIHQPSYSMLNRWIERDLLDELEQQGMGCIVFTALAQGLLTDRYLDGVPEDSRAAREGSTLTGLDDDVLRRVRALNRIARRRGQTLAQLALQWAVRDPRVTSAVIGASSVAQLDANLDAVGAAPLTDEELAEVDEYAVESGINLWATSSDAG